MATPGGNSRVANAPDMFAEEEEEEEEMGVRQDDQVEIELSSRQHGAASSSGFR